jgi:hypothetical protein
MNQSHQLTYRRSIFAAASPHVFISDLRQLSLNKRVHLCGACRFWSRVAFTEISKKLPRCGEPHCNVIPAVACLFEMRSQFR